VRRLDLATPSESRVDKFRSDIRQLEEKAAPPTQGRRPCQPKQPRGGRTMAIQESEGYATHPGEAEDARATAHSEAAVEALGQDDARAVVLALLAVAERLSEVSAYVARVG
jgi:hypothetical protein